MGGGWGEWEGSGERRVGGELGEESGRGVGGEWEGSGREGSGGRRVGGEESGRGQVWGEESVWCVKVADGRGQCYDEASNMSGARKGVAAIILQEESRALYTHCYGHALSLAVTDTMKQSKICRDALDTAFEITRLIKFSPKRNAAFDRIKSSSEDDSHPSPIGIRTFCHTRWTVRGDAIESILVNYGTLSSLWEQCLLSPTRLDPDAKARIIGVRWQTTTFNLLFGLKLCERILKMTDNLSKTL